MKYIQTIENLYHKANERYEKSENKYPIAGSKEGFARINGRINYGWGHTSELQEKYSITIYMVEGKKRVMLSHWGTVTLVIDTESTEVLEFYGESNSDRDSMNTMLELLYVPGTFRYFPSTGDFVYQNGDIEATA